MERLILRAARESDVPELCKLFFRSWIAHWGPHVSVASRERFLLGRPGDSYARQYWPKFTVAERDGAIVGVYHLEDEFLHAIHVAVNHLSTGVGRMMMSDAERRGARRLEVREFNERARQFYLKRGWVELYNEPASEMGTPCVTITMGLEPLSE